MADTPIVDWLLEGAAEASDRPEDQAWASRMREAAETIQRLLQSLHDIAEARQDATLVHELVQQALGYDPDITCEESETG